MKQQLSVAPNVLYIKSSTSNTPVLVTNCIDSIRNDMEKPITITLNISIPFNESRNPMGINNARLIKISFNIY